MGKGKTERGNERWGTPKEKEENEPNDRVPHQPVNGWVDLISEKMMNINHLHRWTDNSWVPLGKGEY